MEVIHNAPFTLADINSAIERMAKSQLTSANAIARVMVMALFAANQGIADEKTGEPKPSADVANALLANLRKGVKKTAIIGVLESLGNLAYASGTFQHFPAAGKDWTPESAKNAKMICANWESYKAEPAERKDADVVEAFDELVQKLIRASTKEKLANGKYLDRLVKLNAEIKGEVFDEVGGV